MSKDWENLDEDQMLNYDEAHTGNMARYERIMSRRLRDAITSLASMVASVSDALSRTNQHIHKEAEKLTDTLKAIDASQGRFNKVSIWLTATIAGATLLYVVITGISVSVMSKANVIQLEMLENQKNEMALSGRPYVFVNFEYTFSPRTDDILFGADMTFQNTGNFPANLEELTYLVADDVTNKSIDFKKWYSDTYGGFPEIKVIPPSEKIKAVYTPGISKKANWACVGVLAKYEGEASKKIFWFKRLDTFKIVRDDKGNIIDLKLTATEVDWDKNQNKDMPKLAIPAWNPKS